MPPSYSASDHGPAVEGPPPAQWVLTEHRRFVLAGTGGGTDGSPGGVGVSPGGVGVSPGGVGVSPATGGWLMQMELNGLQSNAVVRKYTWGLDLAGQSGGQTSGLSGLEGAGGIGGLLAVCAPGAGRGATDLNYVYFYDANGNVGQVIEPLETTAAASIKVKYEYDPYGTRTNLPQVLEFDQPFRFSTKYFDAETGLYYFGYRYYHPKLGRWMSRDPIEELGGANLYSFCASDAIDARDDLGLQSDEPPVVVRKVPYPGGPMLAGCGSDGRYVCGIYVQPNGIVLFEQGPYLNTKHRCDAGCVLAHEKVHKRQHWSCCENALRAAKKAWKKGRSAADEVRKQLDDWGIRNRAAFECEARRSLVACLQGAWTAALGIYDTECGCCLGAEIVEVAASAAAECAKAGGKPPEPCPWDENGNPRRSSTQPGSTQPSTSGPTAGQ
jgi:RHS repeat-associated protein